MKKASSPGFEAYFGAALVACGIAWLWDYFSSLFFPGQAALNLTILSALVYLEAALIGAYGLTRRMASDHVLIGLRVGFGAWMLNMVFRLIVFEIVEALWGLVVYLTGFLVGGFAGGALARVFHREEGKEGSMTQDTG